MRDRCGAKGIVERRPEGVGVRVISLISEIIIGTRTISLPQDISVGMFIPVRRLSEENRGLVILGEQEAFVDEGEIWPLNKGSSVYRFCSDDDSGAFADARVENLVGRKVEIKCEIFDELAAFKRLRAIKRLFSEEG